MTVLDKNRDKIQQLCYKHNVAKLFVFGSILTDKFTQSSDIDFIVDFSGVDIYDYADNYFNLKKALEKLLKKEIDLLEDKAIKNPYLRQSIDSNKKLIYG
jgi:uncharacterized protein